MDQDRVIEALQRQVGCYQRLAKLAEMQHEHVQHGQTEQLLEVLGKRQEELDAVAELEMTIGPAKKRWSEYCGRLASEQRKAAETLVTTARGLLERITAIDRDDALMLQQRKLSLGREIGAARAAKQVNRTYAAAAYGKPAGRLDVGG